MSHCIQSGTLTFLLRCCVCWGARRTVTLYSKLGALCGFNPAPHVWIQVVLQWKCERRRLHWDEEILVVIHPLCRDRETSGAGYRRYLDGNNASLKSARPTERPPLQPSAMFCSTHSLIKEKAGHTHTYAYSHKHCLHMHLRVISPFRLYWTDTVVVL